MPASSKLFEVRDKNTFIPVLATRLESSDAPEDYLLRRRGYIAGLGSVILMRLSDLVVRQYCWDWGGCITMETGHKHITEFWFSLTSGDVIDCELIRGETTKPKRSERFD